MDKNDNAGPSVGDVLGDIGKELEGENSQAPPGAAGKKGGKSLGLIDAIQRGKTPVPPRLMVFGTEGIGKSTFASQAPRPIFVQSEDGLNEVNCDRFPLATSIDDIYAALWELTQVEHDYQTVVIDSLDWTERLIFDAVCREYRVNSIEKADGGYQRGYIHALAYWRKILDALTTLRNDKGMMAIFLAHSKIERVEDPFAVSYDRYSPRLHKHAASMISEWVDCIFFAHWKFRIQTEDAGFGRERNIAVAIGSNGGERVLRTAGGPNCIAKSRYVLSAELPLSWESVAKELFR